MAQAWRTCEAADVGSLAWGETGPRLCAEVVAANGLQSFVQPAETFCPISWGMSYRLVFANRGGPTLVATVEADGCRYAYLGPADRRATTESFWARLAGALGFYTRGNDLFPLPRDMRR